MHRLSRSSRRATAVQRGGAQLFRQGQAMTIALYDMKDSPHARKVRLFAAELGIPLELIPRDPRKGETRAEDFLAKNPNGRVPTLVEGDFVLWESPAIPQDKITLNEGWHAAIGILGEEVLGARLAFARVARDQFERDPQFGGEQADFARMRGVFHVVEGDGHGLSLSKKPVSYT